MKSSSRLMLLLALIAIPTEADAQYPAWNLAPGTPIEDVDPDYQPAPSEAIYESRPCEHACVFKIEQLPGTPVPGS